MVPRKVPIKDSPTVEWKFLTLIFQIKLKKGVPSIRRIGGIDRQKENNKCRLIIENLFNYQYM